MKDTIQIKNRKRWKGIVLSVFFSVLNISFFLLGFISGTVYTLNEYGSQLTEFFEVVNIENIELKINETRMANTIVDRYDGELTEKQKIYLISSVHMEVDKQ